MYFWRKDGKLLKRGKRRARSDRGAVYTEFAFIAPILVMMISAMFEFAGFWDARIMANHAAWTVGRIAMARGSDLTFSSNVAKFTENQSKKIGTDGKNDWATNDSAKKRIAKSLGKIFGTIDAFNDRGVIATMCLMATCQMGYFGGPPGEQINDFLKEGFIKPLRHGIDHIAKHAPKKIGKSISKFGSKFTEGFGALDFIRKFVEKIVSGLVEKLLTVLLKPIDKFLGKHLTGWIGKATHKLDEYLDTKGGESAAKRRVRLFVGAAQRVQKSGQGGIVTILDPSEDKWQNTALTVYGRDRMPQKKDISFSAGKLSFPQFCGNDARQDGYTVKGRPGWPLKGQRVHPLYTVKIAWPYSTGWLFPVLGAMKDSRDADTVQAIGSSLVFASPWIRNGHLDSKNPDAIPPPDKNANSSAEDEMNAIAKDYERFLRMSVYAYKYRLDSESVTVEAPHFHYRSIRRGYNIEFGGDRVKEISDLIGYCSTAGFGAGGHDYQYLYGHEWYFKEYLRDWVHLSGGGRESSTRPDRRSIYEVVLGHANLHVRQGLIKLFDLKWTCKWWENVKQDADGPYRNSVNQLRALISKAFQSNPHTVGDWLCWPDATPSPRYWTKSPLLAIKGDKITVGFYDLRFGGFEPNVDKRMRDRFAETACYESCSHWYFERHLYPASAMESLQEIWMLHPLNAADEALKKRAWKLLERKRNMRTFVWLFNEADPGVDEETVVAADTNLLAIAKNTGVKADEVMKMLDLYVQEIDQLLSSGDASNEALVPDDAEKVDLSDAKAVARWAAKKIVDAKAASNKLLRKINKQIPVVNKAQEKIRLDTAAALKKRREQIERMDRILTMAYKRIAVASRLTRDNLIDEAREIAKEQGLRYELYNEIDGLRVTYEMFLYELKPLVDYEVEYAGLLGSKTANKSRGKSLDDMIKDAQMKRLKDASDRGRSTNEDGPDDDTLGDRFRLIDGRWKDAR